MGRRKKRFVPLRGTPARTKTNGELAEEVATIAAEAEGHCPDPPPGLDDPLEVAIEEAAAIAVEAVASIPIAETQEAETAASILTAAEPQVVEEIPPPPGLGPPPTSGCLSRRKKKKKAPITGNTDVRPADPSDPAWEPDPTLEPVVVIDGMPNLICTEVMMSAVMREARLSHILGLRTSPGEPCGEVRVAFSSRHAAELCVYHFHGCQWDISGTMVTARLLYLDSVLGIDELHGHLSAVAEEDEEDEEDVETRRGTSDDTTMACSSDAAAEPQRHRCSAKEESDDTTLAGAGVGASILSSAAAEISGGIGAASARENINLGQNGKVGPIYVAVGSTGRVTLLSAEATVFEPAAKLAVTVLSADAPVFKPTRVATSTGVGRVKVATGSDTSTEMGESGSEDDAEGSGGCSR